MCARRAQDVCKRCARCVQDVYKMCARCVQDVCKVCARCVQGVLNMCARCMHMSCLISLNPTHLENIAHVGSEGPCRILKKFVHACVVYVIHAKVLPGSVTTSITAHTSTLVFPSLNFKYYRKLNDTNLKIIIWGEKPLKSLSVGSLLHRRI